MHARKMHARTNRSIASKGYTQAVECMRMCRLIVHARQHTVRQLVVQRALPPPRTCSVQCYRIYSQGRHYSRFHRLPWEELYVGGEARLGPACPATSAAVHATGTPISLSVCCTCAQVHSQHPRGCCECGAPPSTARLRFLRFANRDAGRARGATVRIAARGCFGACCSPPALYTALSEAQRAAFRHACMHGTCKRCGRLSPCRFHILRRARHW